MITSSLNFSQLDPKTYKTLVEEKPTAVLVDVRSPGEYAEGHIQNAINIDYYADDFEDDLNLLDKNTPYFVYCRTGERSLKAMNTMKEIGFGEVYDLKGGLVAWQVAFNI